MLRILKHNFGRSLLQVATFSTKNSVLLRNLPISTSSEKLISAIGNLEIKSAQLQPGCSLHYFSAIAAETTATLLSEKRTYQVIGSSSVV
jgi:hypothetical protein